MANTTWEPEKFASLNKLVEDSLELDDEGPTLERLRQQLETLKPDLAALFEYPGKNPQHRAELEKGTPSISGERFKVSTDFIAEAKKLSDFLDIDEDIAATLVHHGVKYEKRFELPAAESAVLLFFGEREAKLMSLATLFRGGASQEVPEFVRTALEKVTGEILASTLQAGGKMFPERIIATMGELKTKQEKITTALNGPTADIPYQREVVEFVQTKFGEERKQLAMLLFDVIRDYQLNSNELISVVEWLRNSSADDPATLRMAVALLVALGTSAEGDNQELAEVAALDKIHHLVSDRQFLSKLNAEIIDRQWKDDGLKGLVWLQWSLLVLFGMKRSPGFDQLIGYREDRVEKLAEQAIQMGAYRFAVDYLLGYRVTDDLEYELSAEFDVLQKQRVSEKSTAVAKDSKDTKSAAAKRYPHFTDISAELQLLIERTLEDTLSAFIGRMSSLVRRMRYSEEDAIYQAQQAEQQRTIQEEQRQQLQQQQQQQQMLQSGYRYSRSISSSASASDIPAAPPVPEPRRDTEALFLWITVLFADRPDAGLRFWGRGDGTRLELDDRLAVFLRWGSDCREQGMIRSYFNMLSSLACGASSSACAFDFMSAAEGALMSPSRTHVASNQAPLCSWSALFGALDFYATQMRQKDPDPLVAAPEIPDAEVALLRAFLRLCRSVARYSIIARTTLYEHQEYNAIMTMFNLLGCTVPVSLKASLIDTIAAFSELVSDIDYADDSQADNVRMAVDEIARRTWTLLEQSQSLPTTNDLEALRLARPAGHQQVPLPDTTPRRGVAIGRSSSSGRAWQSRGGIAYELEEIEAANETYPEMRAFVRLIGALIHTSANSPALSNMERDPVLYSRPSPSIPTDLGESYRIPGVGPYVGFILDSVFLKADQRPYRFPSEKWSVYALSLDVIERCLATMDLSGLAYDPNSSAPGRLADPAVQGSSSSSSDFATNLRLLVTHPGFEIAIRILCGSKLLDNLLQILNVGVDTLNTAAGDLASSIGFSVLSTLRIILRILRLQDPLLRTVIPLLVDSTELLGFPLNLPRSLTTLEQLLLTRQQSVVQMITYINCAASADICLASVKILHILSDSDVFNGIDDSSSRRGTDMLTLNRLVGMIDRSEESVRILHGFINCLELDDDAIAESQSGALISEAAKGFTSGLEDQQPSAASQSIRMAIIDLLLANLSPSKPAPTIAHYLLGFSLTKPASDDLPDASQRATCLHTILDLLRKGNLTSDDADAASAEAYDPKSPALLVSRPRLAERCYHLVYHLCSDPITSDVTMRFLRAREEFFFTQISSIPTTIVPNLQEVDVRSISSGTSEAEILDSLLSDLYSPIRVYAQMHARAWLWRSTALELHMLVLQDSRSRAKRIIEWLVGDADQSSGEIQDDGDVFSVLPGKGTQTFLDSRMRLLVLFDCLRQAYRDSSFTLRRQQRLTERRYLTSESSLAMDTDDGAGDAMGSDGMSSYDSQALRDAAIDTDILNVDIGSCTVANERGCSVYDLHALVALLHQAERSLDSSGALNSTATRQRVHKAIRRVVIRCYFSNQERELFFAYASALRCWREMAEVIVSSAWDKIERGGRVGRERTAFQLLKGLVQVISENDPVYGSGKAASLPGATSWWIEPPTAEQEHRHTELLTVLAPTLALFTEKLSFEWTRSGALTRASLAMNKPGVAGQSRQLPPTIESQLPVEPLLEAWRLLVSSALTPAAQASLHLRGNVYSSMLHFLGGVRKLAAAEAEESLGATSARGLATPVSKQRAKSRLVSGTLDVLTDSALGDRLLESVSADAADASDAWKTVAFCLLDALTSLFSLEPRPNRVVMFLTRRNYFSAYIGSILRREDVAIQSTLQPDPASLNPLYIYEAKMAFFLRLAQRQDGAEKLMENGILDVLADCAFLDLKPSVSSDSGAPNYADAFIPARSERYHQLLMPALDLLLSLVTKIGRDNLTVWMKAARFISQHYSVLEAILKEAALPAHQLSIALLTEVKAVTSLAFYIGRQRAVIDRSTALASSGYVGINALHLPILALLPKFCMTNNWIKRLQCTNDVERAQAQVPASTSGDDAKEPASGTLGELAAGDIEHTIFGQQACDLVDSIVHNVVSYAQSVTELPLGPQLPDQARSFRPAFSWAIEHSRESDYTPSLATLVVYIQRSLARIDRGRRTRDAKLRLSKNSSEMTTADLRKLVASSPHVQLSEDLSTSQMRALASALLAQQGQRISRSVTMLASAVEQALVLLWRHLAYFTSSANINGAVSGGDLYASNGASTSKLPTSMAMPSAQEQEVLKSDASIALPPLLTSLSELKLTADEFATASTHNSFVQMLVRRIKDLVLRDTSVM
ncbi:hypothetical protein GGI12_000323 [Dipsacomyces acuminosporus]|nr:hypothetical protein GGI12_000323 [Dipsacomyces acuminosporus]